MPVDNAFDENNITLSSIGLIKKHYWWITTIKTGSCSDLVNSNKHIPMDDTYDKNNINLN